MPNSYANNVTPAHRAPIPASVTQRVDAPSEASDLSRPSERQLKETISQLRTECTELRQRLRSIPNGTQNAANKVADLERALLSIRKARDTSLAQVLDVTHQLRQANSNLEQLTLDQQSLQHQNDVLQAQLTTLKQEVHQLRRLIQQKEDSYHASVAKLGAKLTETQFTPALERLNAELHAANTRANSLSAHLERVQKEQSSANSALLQQLFKAERDRDAASQAAQERQNAFESLRAELEQTQTRLVEAESKVAYQDLEAGRRESPTDAAAELEKQREQIADLTEQLNAARDELRLAWSLNEQAVAPSAPTAERIDAAEPEPEIEESLSGPVEAKAARASVAEINASLSKALECPERPALISSLASQVHSYGQRALATGSLGAYEVAKACVEVVQIAEKTPEKLDLLAPAVTEALQVLAELAECEASGMHADTTNATVYLLDDDMDNCECIAFALEKYGIQTHYASKPNLALEHLGKERCDLILLDVDLGGMTGFEVHKLLRKIPHHHQTPTLFVSALSSAEAQVCALASESDAFLAKPYTLAVLGLKALQMIVQSRIGRQDEN